MSGEDISSLLILVPIGLLALITFGAMLTPLLSASPAPSSAAGAGRPNSERLPIHGPPASPSTHRTSFHPRGSRARRRQGHAHRRIGGRLRRCPGIVQTRGLQQLRRRHGDRKSVV